MDRAWRRLARRYAVILIMGAAMTMPAMGAAEGDASTEREAATSSAHPAPADRRAAVLAAAERGADGMSVLVEALDDDDALVRRTAARLLGEVGEPAQAPLIAALEHDDALVRRTVVLALGELLEDGGIEDHFASLLDDPNAMVRRAVVSVLANIEPRTSPIVELLKQARQDQTPQVRELAGQALWPFHKRTISVRQRPDMDYELQVHQAIALPDEGWRFHTDPDRTGHLSQWFAPDFDDSDWKPIHIGEAWEPQGWDAYDGVAWYRGRFTLPEEPEHMGVDLFFAGVDESAWVWINGQYVGQHDVGPSGWNLPFRMQVTDALQWGGENQITVRVLDTAYAGGIWKPATLEVLTR